MQRQVKPYRARAALLLVLSIMLIYGYKQWTDARAWGKAVRVPVAGLQPGTSVRVSAAAFQPGAARLVQDLWITRQTDGEFYVFLNRSSFYPDRPLRWIDQDRQFEEPVSSARYGMDGRGRFGPAGRLYRVQSRLDGGHLFILPDRIVSGGPGEPAWLTDLKHLLRLWRPATPSQRPQP